MKIVEPSPNDDLVSGIYRDHPDLDTNEELELRQKRGDDTLKSLGLILKDVSTLRAKLEANSAADKLKGRKKPVTVKNSVDGHNPNVYIGRDGIPLTTATVKSSTVVVETQYIQTEEAHNLGYTED